MRDEIAKAKEELSVFQEFVQKGPLCIEIGSIEKLFGSSKPDILCRIVDKGLLAFELTEICSEEVAELITAVSSAKRRTILSGLVVATSDPTSEVIHDKLSKTYNCECEIDLLCYTNGRTLSTDEQICQAASQCLSGGFGPFRRVWLLGQHGVHELSAIGCQKTNELQSQVA